VLAVFLAPLAAPAAEGTASTPDTAASGVEWSDATRTLGAGGVPALLRLPASPSVTCLKQPDEPVVYPEALLKNKSAAKVPVKLTFTAADVPPAVEIERTPVEIDDAFVEAVRAHVAGMRLPCHQAGDPVVVLRQVYEFVPNDGRKVMRSTPRDESDLARARTAACVRSVSPGARLVYPREARLSGLAGAVMVDLTFSTPDAEPDLKVVATPGRDLTKAVRNYVRNLRLPCLTDNAFTLSMVYQFILTEPGVGRPFLKDVALPAFLKDVKDLKGPVFFDFNTMGCPFDVRLRYYQPYASNAVGQLETANSGREPFLDWMASLRFDLPRDVNLMAVGEEVTVSVPCGTLDL